MLGYALSVRGNEHAGRVVENLREALDALFDRRPRFLGKLALLNVDENADAVTPPRLMELRTGTALEPTVRSAGDPITHLVSVPTDRRAVPSHVVRVGRIREILKRFQTATEHPQHARAQENESAMFVGAPQTSRERSYIDLEDVGASATISVLIHFGAQLCVHF